MSGLVLFLGRRRDDTGEVLLGVTLPVDTGNRASLASLCSISFTRQFDGITEWHHADEIPTDATSTLAGRPQYTFASRTSKADW